MKFAFLIMGNYNIEKDKAVFKDETARMIGVPNLEDACAVAKQLYADGIDCIELCGAFGEAGTKKIIEATGNKIPVGFITHLPEQDDVYKAAFSH